MLRLDKPIYTFLVISFALYIEYVIWRILLSKSSDVLLAFTRAINVGHPWSIWLDVNILIPLFWIDLNESH